MSFRVEAKMDNALRDLRSVHEQLSSGEAQRSLMKVVGVAAEGELRAWFIRRDNENPNKQGWPRQHFWQRIRRATAFDPSRTTTDTATITVSDPAFAAKLQGATIRPTEGRKFLALPMNAEAYGKTPRDGLIPGLFFLRSTAANGGFLVQHGGGAFDDRSANLVFFYRLVPQVTVPKDPEALPPLDQLGEKLGQVAQDFFARRGSSGAIPGGENS